MPVAGSIEHTLQERIDLYKTAISNAKVAGESAKARRYERGLKVWWRTGLGLTICDHKYVDADSNESGSVFVSTIYWYGGFDACFSLKLIIIN